MAATKLQANWVDVSHGATDITRIDSVAFTINGQTEGYSGDGDVFDSVVCLLKAGVQATVTSSDPAVLMGITPGTDATLSATHKDAKGVVAGDILYVLVNAVAQGGQTSGNHAAFGTSSHTFQAYAPDGQTNPLSFTRGT